MLKRFWRALSVAAFGIVVTGLPLTSRLAGIDAPFVDREPVRETALHLPGVEPGTKVVAAALADIDADGDLDLIATDGTLDLLVWSNDGTGHFTRKYPARNTGGSWFARDGALDLGSGSLPASAVPGGSGSLVAADELMRPIDPSERRATAAASSLRSPARLTRASRAPPSPFPLA